MSDSYVGSKLTNQYLCQLHYAELEARVYWYVLLEFQKAHPDKVSIVPPDCVTFVGEGSYEKFQEFCKTLGQTEQRNGK